MPTLRVRPLSEEADQLLRDCYLWLTYVRSFCPPEYVNEETVRLCHRLEAYFDKPTTGTIRNPSQPSEDLAERRRKRMRLVINPDQSA